MSTEKILIIDDEEELASILKQYLNIEGFEVIIASDGESGIKDFYEKSPALVILDIMLPKADGFEICTKIREKSDIPIIILSAKNGEMDKVVTLGLGADDYVTKPFSPMELVARVKANIRRYNGLIDNNEKKASNVINAGILMLNKDFYEAFAGDNEIDFTTKEFELLYFLLDNINHVFSKEQIYENVWGYNEYGDIGCVTVYIKRIREKLIKYNVDCIKTVWGVGYKAVV